MNCSTEHQQPEGCLRNLDFRRYDAGRAQYLKETSGKAKRYTGDCAVIAVAIALNRTYAEARGTLHRRWSHLHPRENNRTTSSGRILGAVLKYAPTPLLSLRKHEPMNGTPSIVYGGLLEIPINGFAMIYGENQGQPQVCLCEPQKVFVVDGYVPSQDGSHVTAIKDGSIIGDFDVRDDFQITHIWVEKWPNSLATVGT